MDRKERKRRDEKRQARRVALAHPDPDRPSTYIQAFEDVPPGSKVVIACRVSGETQEGKGNNKDQEANMNAAILARNGIVAKSFSYCGKADLAAPEYRHHLCGVAQYARENNCMVLFESTDRIVRRYPINDGPPDAKEFQELIRSFGGVVMATLHHPDATPSEQHAAHITRGQEQKGNKGGRPPKPEPVVKTANEEFAALPPGKQRPALLSKTFWFRHVGFSVRETADMMDKEPKQIQRWIEKLEADAPVTTELEAPRPRRKYNKKSTSENG